MMVKSSLVVLFCAMLFIGGCCSKSGCPFGKKENACIVTTECCPKALAEKCAKASTCSKAAAATSSEPATCSSQTAK